MSYDFTVLRDCLAAGRMAAVCGSALLAASLIAAPSAMALQIPTACQSDAQGANDEPGQKDLSKFCADDGVGTPFELHTIVNWDEISLSGANTADICTLYDSDANGLADLAVCITLVAGVDNIAILGEVRLFRCADDKPDRCTTPTLVSGPNITTCEVTQQKTDPFSPAAPNGPGDAYPNDTELLCAIDLDEFGPTGQDAVLLDACSYPSNNPNSDPSDCVALAQCETDDECDDANVCTTDNCNHDGVCAHKPRGGNVECSDGLFCNGDDECNASGLCQPNNGSRDCGDDVTCTVDTCNEFIDQCVHTPQNSICSDNQFCNGIETCSVTDDCQPGTPPNCSDGQFCNGPETCDPEDGCQPAPPPNCDDSVACTLDSCNESGDVCDHLPDSTQCGNGDFCDGEEVCDPEDGCQPGPDPCPELCNEETNQCVECLTNADCLNADFCDGTETCNVAAGLCVPGTPPNCSDDITCTADSCNEGTNSCDHAPNNGLCSDAQFCNGSEICTVGVGCGPGTAPSCADAVTCTTDTCDEINDVCVHTPNNGSCSNSLFCDGTEICDAINGCQNGTAPNCNDNVPCTGDSCNETLDRCDHAPDNAVCSDGLFCNGTELCVAPAGCTAGTPVACSDAFVCTTDTCNETTDLCESNFSNCVCGDNEVTGVEVCDPPATAGSFEDCHNSIDDDGDGRIDCRDPSCKPGARPPICDEACTLDQVCEVFIRDPASIIYNREVPGLDVLFVHGRIPISGSPDPLVDGLTFEIMNEYRSIYRAELGFGDFSGKPGGTVFTFRDKDAPLIGQSSFANGLSYARLKLRLFRGKPHLVFTIRAYADLTGADQWLMTTELAVGSEVGFLTKEWKGTPSGWKLNDKEFDE